MACDNFKGRDFAAQLQFNDALPYGSAPASPDALLLRFSSMTLDRKSQRVDDPTISQRVLMEKADEVDETPDGTLTSIADLGATAYAYFKALFGAPTTTGTSPGPYTHVFTMTNACKPDFLLELFGVLPVGGDVRNRRFLGTMLRDFTWDMLSTDQNWTANLLAARSVRPYPTTKFDTTPNSFAKGRAIAAKCIAYDVVGASTLGDITGLTLKIDTGLDPKRLADGQYGYGKVLPGQIGFSGTIEVILKNSGIPAYAEANTLVPLTLKTEGPNGESLTLTIPHAQFNEPAESVSSAQTITRQYEWMARDQAGDGPVTLVLVNNVPGITTA